VGNIKIFVKGCFHTQLEKLYQRLKCSIITVLLINRRVISIFIRGREYDVHMPGGRPPKSLKRTSFGQRLFDARQLKGLSQHQIAKAVGVTQTSYSDWERTGGSFHPEVLLKLAQVLGMPVGHLLGETPLRSSSGPAGKLRKVFEAANSLPRYHQRRIIALIEDILTAYQTKAAQKHD
jgi:transcriptional regulator with XRE-family HTH domain